MTASYDWDCFPCGLVITTVEERKILFANKYFYAVSQQEEQNLSRIGDVFTPASKIVVESFIMPMLLHQSHCEEVQLTLQTSTGQKIPILLNAQIVTAESRVIYWTISTAQQRDSLFQELVNLRNELETRAEKLEVLSQTDELSGLLNRRAFLSKVSSLIKQAKRHKLSYSFFMLDIDYFKKVNDRYGHDVGDKVIQKLGSLLKNNCREHDIVARIGGEEFAICSMNNNKDGPAVFAQKLLSVIRAEKIEGINVTVSIGFTTSSKAGFEELFKEADAMLYEAKNGGRDQLAYKTS